MTRRVTCLVALVVFLALTLGAVPPAAADHLEVEASVPEDVQPGDVMEMRVVVRSAETQQRIPDAVVSVHRDATIAGVSGEVELTSTVTDELGVAILRWQQRAGGSHTITVDYTAPGESEFETATLSVVNVGAGPQVVRSTSGVQIPGFGAWVLIAVLAGTWGIIQFALLGPMAVAREGMRRESAEASAAEGGAS